MIGEIIGLLQSPAKTVIGALLAERKGKAAEQTAPAASEAPKAPEAPSAPDAPAAPQS